MKINKELLTEAFLKEPVIIFIGQSGCGKETQTNALIKMYKELCPGKEVYISETGGLYRSEIPKMAEFSKKRIGEIQSAGKLQSWITTAALWGSIFFYNYNGGLIIVDGSPRNPEETLAVFDFYNGFAKKKIIVFILDISDKEADRRMIARNEALIAENKSPRSDTDTPEKRQTKIAYYHTNVQPAIDCLDKFPEIKVYEINGMDDPPVVTEEIFLKLSKYHST